MSIPEAHDQLRCRDGAERPGTADRGWPELRASRNEPCDGTSETGQPCVLGYHDGYHRDAADVEWLDR
ncbi:hypothetical protein OHB24_21335 [Kribbella sp. NBC_00482]|uniref:hypothetical protein n=1 Tax=Kribbella sp. NBC_00482 TaxID=2975968 RepID=UPI002E199B11